MEAVFLKWKDLFVLAEMNEKHTSFSFSSPRLPPISSPTLLSSHLYSTLSCLVVFQRLLLILLLAPAATIIAADPYRRTNKINLWKTADKKKQKQNKTKPKKIQTKKPLLIQKKKKDDDEEEDNNK